MKIHSITALFFFLLLSPARDHIHQTNFIQWDYCYVKLNESILFDSNKDDNRKWEYFTSRKNIGQADSLSFYYGGDCNSCGPVTYPMIVIKDSLNKNFIRRYENTDKITLKDVLRYFPGETADCWLLYSEQAAEKDGTILGDINKTYPKMRRFPGLHLKVTK